MSEIIQRKDSGLSKSEKYFLAPQSMNKTVKRKELIRVCSFFLKITQIKQLLKMLSRN